MLTEKQGKTGKTAKKQSRSPALICQTRKSPLSACYVKVSSVIAFIASSATLTLSHTALKSVRSNMAYRIVTCRAKKGPAKKQIRTNFDLRNSSDLFVLVTRTGIEPMLPP